MDSVLMPHPVTSVVFVYPGNALHIDHSIERRYVYSPPIFRCDILLYTNKLYSKILHPVADEVTMLQTSNTRSYTLSRSSNTRSYIILRASNTQSYITLRASNTQGYMILRTSNTRTYTCHGRVTYEITNFHRRITHDHTRVTQQVHRYYY
jgi:hypothetical protein